VEGSQFGPSNTIGLARISIANESLFGGFGSSKLLRGSH